MIGCISGNGIVRPQGIVVISAQSALINGIKDFHLHPAENVTPA